MAVLSAPAGWGLSVSPSCATQLSHTAVLPISREPTCVHSWGLLAWKWDYLCSVYLHEHLPGLCPSSPRWLTITYPRFLPCKSPRLFVCVYMKKVCFPGGVGIFPFSKPIYVPLWFSQHPAPVGEHFNYPEHFTANSHFAAIHLRLRLWAASAVFTGCGEGTSGALSWSNNLWLGNHNWISCRHLQVTMRSYINPVSGIRFLNTDVGIRGYSLHM